MDDFQTTTLRMLQDNFVHMIHDGSAAIVVDPSDSAAVMEFLEANSLQLTHIMITHHHADHTGGCAELKRRYSCTVIGPADWRIPWTDENETSTLPFPCNIIQTPGHTSSHVAYHLPGINSVFTGDTLFLGGCGRIFEGTPMQMWQSLLKLRGLPLATEVYPGHDYTLDNLEFCQSVLPSNTDIEARLAGLRASSAPWHASLIIERLTNVFLMCDDPTFTSQTGMTGYPGEIFEELRRRKDNW